MKKFAATLSNTEYAEARRFEAAGLCSISQAVKAFERGETRRINEWRQALAAKKAN
jgi:hypothetical protein